MSERILVLSVGGSTEPVIQSIRDTLPAPDRLAFLATTTGGDLPNGSDVQIPDILETAGWTGAAPDVVTTTMPDRLDEVWRSVARLARGFPPDADVVANYTTGTKSMVAGLAMYGLHAGWKLQLHVGSRMDFGKVTGAGYTTLVSVMPFHVEGVLRSARLLAERGDHWGAEQRVAELLGRGGLPPDDERRLRRELIGYRFADALERYDFSEARRLFDAHRPQLAEQAQAWGGRLASFLETLAWLRNEADARSVRRIAPALDLVTFLLETARRTAEDRARYDDAFSRLYRATELLAQIVLRFHHGVDTGAIDEALLPESGKARPVRGENGRLHVGLMQAYQLLADFGHPLGTFFEDTQRELFGLLQFRNQSWLAHGFQPIDARTWQGEGRKWLKWLDAALERARRKPPVAGDGEG